MESLEKKTEGAPYRRLKIPGLKRRVAKLVHAYSLWEGPDHLLIRTEASMLVSVAESFSRIYFRDILAVQYRQTSEWLFKAALGGGGVCLLLLLGLILWMGSYSIPGAWFLFGISAVVMLPLGLGIAAGPTCEFHIWTATGKTSIDPVKHLRVARRFAAYLREKIAVEQAGLAWVEAPVAPVAQPPPVAPLPVIQPPILPGRMPMNEGGPFQTKSAPVFFLLAALLGLNVGLDLLFDHVGVTLSRLVVGAVVFSLGVHVLVKIQQSRGGKALLAPTWGVMAVLTLTAGAAYVCYLVYTIHSDIDPYDVWPLLKALSSEKNLVLRFWHSFEVIALMAISAWGMARLHALARQKAGG
jgi:hypothetical protein